MKVKYPVSGKMPGEDGRHRIFRRNEGVFGNERYGQVFELHETE